MLECRLGAELSQVGVNVFLAGQYSEHQFDGKACARHWLTKGITDIFWLRYKNFWMLPIYVFRLVTIIRKHKISHVITHNEGADILAGVARTFAEFEHVIAFHTYYLRLPFTFKSELWRYIIRRASAIYAVSQYVNDVNASTFGYKLDNSAVVYNSFLQLKAIDAPEILHTNFVLMVGRIHPQKDYECAFNVLAKVFSKRKDVVALIAGATDDQDYKLRIENLAREAGIASKIIFVGAVSNIAAYMEKASVLLHTPAHEGFGLVLLEAIQHSLPVVTVETGGIPEVLKDTPFKPFRPNDINGLASETCYYLSVTKQQRSELFQFKNNYLSFYDDKRRAREIHNILLNRCAGSVA